MMSSPLAQTASFGAGFPWNGPSYQPQQQAAAPVFTGASSFAGFSPMQQPAYSFGGGLQPYSTSLAQFFGPSSIPYAPAASLPIMGQYGAGSSAWLQGLMGRIPSMPMTAYQGGFSGFPVSPYMGGTPNFPVGMTPYMPASSPYSTGSLLGGTSLSQLLSGFGGSSASGLSGLLGGFGGSSLSSLSSLLGGLGGSAYGLSGAATNPLALLGGQSSLSSLLSAYMPTTLGMLPGVTNITNAGLAPLLGSLGGSSASSISSLLASLKPATTATATAAGTTDINKLLSSLLGTSSTGTTDINALLSSLLGTTATASSTATTGTTDINKLLSSLLGGTGSTDINALLKSLLGGSSTSVDSIIKSLGLTTPTTPTVAGPTPVATTTTNPSVVTTPTTSTPTTVTTGAGPTNTAWGDPHIVYSQNGKKLQFDFQGAAGKVYNMFKDGTININSKFKSYGGGGATVMESFGFNLNGKKLQVEKGKATLDGVALEKGKEYSFDTGIAIPDKPGETYKGTIKTDGKNVTVNAGEYIFTAKDQGGYFDLDAQATNIGTLANGLDAAGVIGETFDADHKNYGKGGKTGANAQGEGYLNYGGNGGQGYLADDLFDATHNYTEDKHDVKLGVGAGQTGKGTK